MPSDSDTTQHSREEFPATRWTMIVNAQDGSDTDLEYLLKRYWYPLYAFARRSGKSCSDAEDLTQAFIVKLLSKGWIDDVDRSKGKMRTFLLTRFQSFMRDEWRKENAQKRGGGATVFSINAEEAEEGYSYEPSDGVTPEDLFDQAWASTLLKHVLEQVAASYEKRGQIERFHLLQPCLAWNSSDSSYAELAEKLELSEAGVKSAVHRLRQEYRRLLESEIGETVTGQAEIDAEVAQLFAAFS